MQSKKTGLICEQKTTERKMNCIRVTCPSNYDALTSFRAMGNSELRKKYDKNMQTVKSIEHIGVNFMVGYQRTWRMFTVASRDMYQHLYWTIDDKDRIFVIGWDTSADDLPEEQDCVRMLCPIGGFVFEPLENDKSKCMMTMIVEADVRGQIPQFIQKQAMKDSAESLSNLKELMKGWVEKNKAHENLYPITC